MKVRIQMMIPEWILARIVALDAEKTTQEKMQNLLIVGLLQYESQDLEFRDSYALRYLNDIIKKEKD